MAAAFLVGAAPRSRAQSIVDLGTAADFAILAGSGITFSGPTTVTGHLGSHSVATITGADHVMFLSGVNHAGDATTQAAKSDLTAAYDDAVGRSGNVIAAALGGTTRTPGVYAAGTFSLTGDLTLDGAGVYIFQAGSTLDVAAGSRVVLTNGASAAAVFWQVGTSATFLTDVEFAGNVLAFTSITLGSGTVVDGRMLAQNGAVTFGGMNAIATPAAIPEPAASAALAAAALGLFVVLRRRRPMAAR